MRRRLTDDGAASPPTRLMRHRRAPARYTFRSGQVESLVKLLLSTRCTSLLAGSVAAAVLAVSPSLASELSDLRRERERAREAEQQALEQLDLLRVNDEAVQAALDEIEALIAGQQIRVDAARKALADAEQDVLAREQALAEGEAAVQAKERELQNHAVTAYVGTNNALDPWLMSQDVNRTAVRLAFIDLAAGTDRDLVDELRGLRAELQVQVEQGQQARSEADRYRAELEDALNIFEQRRATQSEIQNQIQVRLNEWLAEAEQAAAESEEFTQLILRETALVTGLEPGSPSLSGFIMPTRGTVGSSFGPRLHPIFRTVRQHTGVDIGAATGTPIWASKSGRVIYAGWKGGYGNTVVVLHNDGAVSTLYAHMSVLHASNGDRVDQGELIGEVGSTGWSTGPHLHFEVRVNGVPKDPIAFLP
jgi:murein DD-endopeptidase MepM/ murein hydrolase activator NlpD